MSGSSNDPNTRANLTVENLEMAGGKNRLSDRQSLLGLMRRSMPSANSESIAAIKHQAVYDQAMRMVETRGEGAFDLDEEETDLRDAYGRNRFGQGCLLARRLVERGVPFIEVTLDRSADASWDSHLNNFRMVKTMCEVLDPAWSTLISDLRDRGMLEETMVVWMGEFGRTPKINNNSGRDHFPDAWSVAMAGANVAGGQVYGSSGKDGMEAEDPVNASDLYATLLEGLGIDYASSNDRGDRPIPIVDEGGAPVTELLS